MLNFLETSQATVYEQIFPIVFTVIFKAHTDSSHNILGFGLGGRPNLFNHEMV